MLRYELTGSLGSGSFGQVYAATHKVTGQQVNEQQKQQWHR